MKKKILLFLFITLQITLFHHVFALAKITENYFKGKFYSSVKNNFLIATEKMNDSRFEKTVIAMLENDEDGAWGLVINKPLGSFPLAMLIDPSLSNTPEEREKLYGINILIFWGGPVDIKEIFILHSTEYKSETTKNYGNISISQDYTVLSHKEFQIRTLRVVLILFPLVYYSAQSFLKKESAFIFSKIFLSISWPTLFTSC